MFNGFNGSTVLRPWLCGTVGSLLTSEILLQWVHGPQTVVMAAWTIAAKKMAALQWVHGPQTVVMVGRNHSAHTARSALQWVHGPQTVVMTTALNLR